MTREEKAAYDKIYRAKNRDKRLARGRAYYWATREKQLAVSRAWRRKNKDKARAHRKAYAAANPERDAAWKAAWYDRNKEQQKVAKRQRYLAVRADPEFRKARALYRAQHSEKQAAYNREYYRTHRIVQNPRT